MPEEQVPNYPLPQQSKEGENPITKRVKQIKKWGGETTHMWLENLRNTGRHGLEVLASIGNKEDQSTETSVVKISNNKFDRLVSKLPHDTVTIAINTWAETDGTKPIYNKGAGPCLIIYGVNKATGHIVSGHFPEVLEERQRNFERMSLESAKSSYANSSLEEIALPTQREIRRFSSEHAYKDPSYEAYTQMKGRLKEMIAADGLEQINVYLFGNNFAAFGRNTTEHAQRTIDAMIGQHDISFDLFKSGIPYTRQHDYRVPGQDQTDHTYYSPRNETIYSTATVHESPF